jgi:hypothetical protein
MSKFLNIPDGNYLIKVKELNGKITLDATEVSITGNLVIEGDTTTVNTQNLTVEDRIVLLNSNENGPGITGVSGAKQSGIQIKRGAGTTDAFFVYDEETDIENQAVGAFRFYTGPVSQTPAALQTNLIATDGSDFRIATGSGVLRVLSSGYTDNILLTSEGPDTTTNNSYIPNFEAVKTYVATFADTNPPSEAVSGDTKFQARDVDEVIGLAESTLNLIVDNATIGYVRATESKLHNINFSGSTISTVTSGTDLNLVATGTGNVRIADSLHLDALTSATPTTPSTGTVLYYDAANTKDTGIYYKNSQGKQGEIASRRAAVLFSLIF